jgi:hypothetical protein
MPSTGYNIPYLKEMIGSSTLIYIRPMKSVISMKKLETSATSASPTNECARCKERVPISNLRQHNLECEPITVDTGDSDVSQKPITIDIGESEEEQEFINNEVVPVIDEGEGPSKITWSAQLKELFPDSEVEELEEVALQSTSMDEAAEFMLDKLGTEEDESVSLEDLIELFVKKNSLGYSEDEYFLLTESHCGCTLLGFTKNRLGNMTFLLSVSFKDEDGLDGGAMEVELFALALQEEVIISHSVSQKASIGFPTLAPYLYAYIVGYAEDEIALLMKKDYGFFKTFISLTKLFADIKECVSTGMHCSLFVYIIIHDCYFILYSRIDT